MTDALAVLAALVAAGLGALGYLRRRDSRAFARRWHTYEDPQPPDPYVLDTMARLETCLRCGGVNVPGGCDRCRLRR